MSIYNSSNRFIAFFDSIIPADIHHLIGDLEEEFQEDLETHSPAKARALFTYRLVKATPYFILKSFTWNFIMIWNYLKVALRNIKKYKTFSLINVVGLASSIAICLLIILFIYDQKSYDRWHQDSESIYRITSDFKSSGNLSSHRYATSPSSLAEILRNDVSAVEAATLIRRSVGGEGRVADNQFRVFGLYADEHFPKVFSFEFSHGNPETALESPYSIVLSKETSRKFFGSSNPIGQNFNLNGRTDYTVTGVVDMDVRSHINFDILVSFSTQQADQEYAAVFLDNWRNSFYRSYTYIKLREGQDISTVDETLPQIIETHYESTPESYMAEFIPQGLTKISLGDTMDNQLGSVMSREPVYYLLGFAVIIIFIACFNYVGLTIARGLSRGKEVGVRKALGAFNSSVRTQFILEAVIVALLSMVFAIALLKLFLPEFNNLQMIRYGITRSLTLEFGRDIPVFGVFVLFTIFIGLAAGLFPALHLSTLRAAEVLKGLENVRGFSRSFLRKGLVVLQFAFSVMFIVTALTLNQQFSTLIQSDYGYNQESLIHLELGDIPLERVKNQFASNPQFQSISGTSVIPGLNSRSDRTISSSYIDFDTRGNHFSVDEDYLETMELELIAGRNFSAEYTSDLNGPMLITEQTVRRLGLGTPQEAIGEFVAYADSTFSIIGVVEDFVSSDVTIEPEAVIIQFQPEQADVAIFRIAGKDVTSAIATIEKEWEELGGGANPDISIFSEELKEAYSLLMFKDMIKLIQLFAVFSVIISCLGLFGMAMFNAEIRTKEIGIRKVLGAQSGDILILLSKEYIWMVGIAVLIGAPLANLLNGMILSEVANSIGTNPFIYLAGIGICVLLAVVTVGTQSLKASWKRVIESIRVE